MFCSLSSRWLSIKHCLFVFYLLSISSICSRLIFPMFALLRLTVLTKLWKSTVFYDSITASRLQQRSKIMSNCNNSILTLRYYHSHSVCDVQYSWSINLQGALKVWSLNKHCVRPFEYTTRFVPEMERSLYGQRTRIGLYVRALLAERCFVRYTTFSYVSLWQF